jgi:chemotaxis family two-component system response regulator Rcp1
LFRILVVDDNRAQAILLKEVMTDLRCRYELHFVWDGLEALDFLHGRGAFADAPRPNLILLDINMPRLGGLETLSAIKSDPELYVIPVIMFSSSASPQDVRESYLARANCYVQKPSDLERSVKLVQVVEAFWMDFATLPVSERRRPKHRQAADSKMEISGTGNATAAGYPIAIQSGEARSRAMQERSAEKIAPPVRKSGCQEYDRLLNEFGVAVRELLTLHEQQLEAITDGDSESSRFDILIHMANESKHRAKYAYLRHVESHDCSKMDANQTRT